MAKGLPEYVTAYVHKRIDKELDYNDVLGQLVDNVFLNIQMVHLSHTQEQERHTEIFLVLPQDGAVNGSYMVKKQI